MARRLDIEVFDSVWRESYQSKIIELLYVCIFYIIHTISSWNPNFQLSAQNNYNFSENLYIDNSGLSDFNQLLSNFFKFITSKSFKFLLSFNYFIIISNYPFWIRNNFYLKLNCEKTIDDYQFWIANCQFWIEDYQFLKK